MKLPKIERRSLVFYIAVVLAIVVAYTLLHTRYRFSHVDDAWSCSFTYNTVVKGIEKDLVFREAGNPRADLFFSKTYRYLYGSVLSVIGFTKGNGHILSSLLLLFSSIIWFFISRKFGYSKQIALFVSVLIIISPPFFSIAHIIRPDALSFLFLSLILLLFLHERYFLSGLLLLVSFENHPITATVLFYIIAWMIYKRQWFLADKKRLIKNVSLFFVGAVVGGFVFYRLHQNQFDTGEIAHILHRGRTLRGMMINNYILSYFFPSPKFWWIHGVEFWFALITIVFFFVKKIYREEPFTAILFISLFASTIIMKRGNGFYMIFFFPALIYLVAVTFRKYNKISLLFKVIFVYLFVFYGAHYVAKHSYDFQESIDNTARYASDKSLPVVGVTDDWFAFYDRKFYPTTQDIDLTKLEDKEIYFVRKDYIGFINKDFKNNYRDAIKILEKKYDFSQVKKFKACRNGWVEILKGVRKSHNH